MLYENSDPFRLAEPGGVLDVTDADYRALDERRVRVTGSRWEPKPYTMKLEGAGGGPFQTFMLVGIEDPDVLEDVDAFVARMAAGLARADGPHHGRLRPPRSTSRFAPMAGTRCPAAPLAAMPRRRARSA